MSNTESVTTSVISADAGTEQEVLTLSAGETFSPTDFHAAYEDGTGTARTVVQILDGTGGDVIETVPLLTSEGTSITDVNRTEMEESIVVLVEASADGPVTVTVGGEMVTG